MPTASSETPASSTFRRWLETLEFRDKKLHEELQRGITERLGQRPVVLEGVKEEGGVPPLDLVLETIVRVGRPALPVMGNRISATDPGVDGTSQQMIDRLKAAAPVVEPLIPLVGRIDVTNHAGGLEYVGTGWLVEPDVVVTNRHVAELIAKWDGGKYVFRSGRFGDDLDVSIDYRHELGINATASAHVVRVIWIETDARKADIALLQVGRRTDGTFQDKIELAQADATPNCDVVVIGYPARAPSYIIPDQAWMDRIYGGTYDIKRVAPGLMGVPSRGWATHDCTTLGGNSGSVVLDMKTGRAVALHFAGLYMIENYCVPASTIRDYLRVRPWQLDGRKQETAKSEPQKNESGAAVVPPQAAALAPSIAGGASDASGEVTVTIPLTIRISLGKSIRGDLVSGDRARFARSTRVLDAARSLDRAIHGNGVLAVRHGYLIVGNELSDTACLVVAADPRLIDYVRARAPQQYGGFPVDVRPAPLSDQVDDAAIEFTDETQMKIAYNDNERKGKSFSFDWVEEKMDVLAHVGPERSWSVLSDFIGRTERDLVSSIYEFHAAHIADAIESELEERTHLTLVMAAQSRDPKGGDISPGEFDRSDTFEKWESKFKERFERIFVPVGNGGLVAKAYHIKVTVRDGDSLWLSSGNWKRQSQPHIPASKLYDPRETGKAGNREWHVTIGNNTLAQRFRNHILADYQKSLDLGGTPEAVELRLFIDVPVAALEAIQFEAAPSKVFDPLPISRTVRVKPLLTPDLQGEIYTAAVLKLIRSARNQILFQNQYITVSESSSGFFGDLVDALVEKSNEIDDVRIILRSGGTNFWDNMAELKRRGMDVNRCVRRISATHTKGIIVDGTRVLIGSHNWSALGVTLNRDASLIFDDSEIAQYFEQVFEVDWDRAAAAQPEAVLAEAPRLATGPEPPPGFVRIPLADYLEG